MGMRNLLIVLCVLFQTAGNGIAAEYYVKNGGSDSGAGTSGDPWETISKVNTSASAGDTVYFDSASTWSASSGTAVLLMKAGVTYIGNVWGSGTRAKIEGTSSSISRAVVYFNDDHSTYETALIGFEVDGNQYEMDGVSMLHNGSENSDLVGAIKRVEDCVVHDVSDNGNWYGYGIIVAPNTTNENVENVEIINNEVYNIGRTAINIYPYTGCTTCTVDYVTVYGNETYNLGQDQGSAGHGILLKNNISYVETECNLNRSTGSTGHSIAVEDYNGEDPLYLTIRYNIMVNSIRYYNVDTSTYTVSDNQTYAGDPETPPEFDSYCDGEDTTPPEVSSSSIGSNGETVTVNFTETVVTTGYDNGDFDLDCTTAGNDISLNSISGSGSSRTFTAATVINSGDTCNLDYTGGADEIEDSAGNDLETFSNDSVTNNSTETVPSVSSTSIASDGETITVNFTETVVTTGYDNGDFDLDCTTAGNDISLNSISGSGSSRTFTAASTIDSGDTCNLDYTGGADEIEDTDGYDLETFSNESVTNNSTQPPPTVTSASIGTDGETITVNFSETVVTTGYDNGDFDLDCTVAGIGISLNSISGSGSSRTFTAATTINDGDTCNLDYTGGADEIEDSAGNDMEAFSNVVSTNNSGLLGHGSSLSLDGAATFDLPGATVTVGGVQ